MSASIEHLLHVQREKQRLDDELRIAREIQKSLLPVQLPLIPGLDIADLCEPAREVGGDYYDFLRDRPAPAGRHDRRRLRQGHVGRAVHGRAQGLMLALSHTSVHPASC
jgi:hypothetical protein